MIKSGLKIGIVLTLILVLPSLFFSAYEISNLSKNEAVIDSIYTGQLESVLFSLNQYSDDVLSGWANQLERETDDIETIITKNYSIDAIGIKGVSGLELFAKKKIPDDSINSLINQLEIDFASNLKKIELLRRYVNNGYRKIEALSNSFPHKSLFAFAAKQDSVQVSTVLLLLDTDKFIRENLGPKIQMVAQDRFYISVYKENGSLEVFANINQGVEDKNIKQKKAIWLLPGYELGIQMRGNTIEDLVRERTRTNIILLIVMDIILLLGAWFVFKNIRKQIKLNQLKTEFISNVSHEIRTPLALINMYSETLEMGRIPSEEKKKEYYKVINIEANRLSKMVNKILNFSRIERGKREYHFSICNLNNEIETILENYKQHFDQNGFEIELKLADKMPELNLDKEAVAEAIINLIDNGMKYSADVKKLAIGSSIESAYVRIQVKDFGIGIEKKDQPFVFDKFYRVTSGNLAHKAKGSGIGLSIVKHIMEAHNGKVELDSIMGKGSCFTLFFPLK
ncbi:sensor histidine kinase [Marinifilum sp.]|uniref:sensor histidine kinase n=1 Tax=Marinifilum sp. TaxID=2033137 RepID=UPI003BAADCAC